MKIFSLRAVLAAICLCLAGSSVFARPAHKQALGHYLGTFLTKKLNDCHTCHLPDPEGKPTAEETEKPHNSFGARLKAVKAELRKAGKATTIDARLEAVAQEDSDGDGVSNLIELLAGRFPGDAKDRPAAQELAEARKTLAAFEKAKQGYPWRPFDVVRRPDLPRVKNSAWVHNPIDAFIAAEHEALGLKPRSEAPKAVLLRRLYLDLIGLPPTPKELHEFLGDSSEGAYEKVVNRLLNSPQYGERWGRHWMDVWRYSDWAGYGAQIRDSQPHIWRWRDWIIESLNEDKGYDRMVLEMLAGDELAPEDPKALAATGYLVRNFKLLSREKWMQDTVEHTTQAFLGVTLGCARCHDHMFDPILQKEYYQVRAIFEPHHVRTDRIPGFPDTTKNGLVRAYDARLEEPTWLFIRGDDRTPDKSKPMAPGVPDVLGGDFKLEPIKLPLTAVVPDRRPFVLQELIAGFEKSVELHDQDVANAERATWTAHLVFQPVNAPLAALTRLGMQPRLEASRQGTVMAREAGREVLRMYRLLAEVERLEDLGKANTPEWAKVATERTASERRFAFLKARNEVFRLKHGFASPDPKGKVTAEQRRAEVEKALAKAEADLKLPASTNYTKRTVPTFPKTSTGRRLAFARWIADRDNPLTARVAVNHIWLRHFGQALVPSVFDFGRNGRPPSHPALLDWLAAEFMESGWKMKALHRLIVTSNTYRQASTPDLSNVAIDRDNKYLWRMTPRRAEAEVVRDCIFYVGGTLDLTMGGPDIVHKLGLTTPRRSLYFQHAAEKQMEFLEIFDGPSVTECYERRPSIIPQQALALINSDLTLTQARLLARRLAAKTGSDSAMFIRQAFEHTLSRPPSATELAECTTFLDEQTARHASAKRQAANETDGRLPSSEPAVRARENLVHVLMNHHEFVTIR
jgi:hypothetical protein